MTSKQDTQTLAASLFLNTLEALAQNRPGHVIADASQLRRDPALEGALDEAGGLVVHPAEFWHQFNQPEISHFCARFGYYCLPTAELVAWLTEKIAGRRAIEIGAGSGVLAKALGIPATDNRMQEWPEMIRAYRSIGAAPIRYGQNVKPMEAMKAVKALKPRVVIGTWITHKFRPHEEWRKGNQYGVEEDRLIKHVEMYVHVGHTRIHEPKPALEIPHGEFEAPWLVSRAIATGHNYICWWGE
jgi:hypothetical protein